jgi:hypothetical protein
MKHPSVLLAAAITCYILSLFAEKHDDALFGAALVLWSLWLANI